MYIHRFTVCNSTDKSLKDLDNTILMVFNWLISSLLLYQLLMVSISDNFGIVFYANFHKIKTNSVEISKNT